MNFEKILDSSLPENDRYSSNHIIDSGRFEMLLEIAEELCLENKLKYDASDLQQGPEADLIAKLGTRGLRHAIEFTEEEEYKRENLFLNFDEDGTPIHPLWSPELFNGPLDRKMLMKARMFGEALMDEAFEVIGADAHELLDEFMYAENDMAQIAVLNILHNRLHSIGFGTQGLEETESKNDSYSPLRLSPKIIGSYPDIKLAPTCLGIAAIGAGFFKKAGARFMHAGVMETSRQAEQEDLHVLMLSAKHMCDELGVGMPDTIKERLEKKLHELFDVFLHDNGTHSALLVQLKSGNWYQFDPNLDLSCRSPEFSADEVGSHRYDAKLDRVYGHLNAFRDIAPGLEVSACFPRGSFQGAWHDFVSNLKPFDSAAMDSMLRSSPEASAMSNICKKVKEWLLDDGGQDINRQLIDAYLLNFEEITEKNENVLIIDTILPEAVTTFVFEDKTEAEWMEKYLADDAFRDRALRDIARLAVLLGIRFGLELAVEGSVSEFHSKLELGLPETSIGLAVLHNIGLYVADDISPNYWISLWPSHLIPPDVLHRQVFSARQKHEIELNLMHLYRISAFRYTHTYAKLIEHHRGEAGNDAG